MLQVRNTFANAIGVTHAQHRKLHAAGDHRGFGQRFVFHRGADLSAQAAPQETAVRQEPGGRFLLWLKFQPCGQADVAAS